MAEGIAKVRWTDEQQAVIDHRNGNLLVSAAAGSGKTAVLIEHILSLVCSETDPRDIDRLLVVTFTRAAAAEMRERLYKGLNKRLDEAERDSALGLVKPAYLHHLQRQLKLLPHAMVCTIDSFCMHVVQNHISMLDLDPAFRVADRDEAKLIRNDVLTDLLEAAYEEGTETFIDFAEAFMSTKDDASVKEAILSLYMLSEQSVDPDALLAQYLRNYTVETKEELRKLPWFIQYSEDFRANAPYAKSLDEDLILTQAALTRPAAEELVRLTKAFRAAYQEEKSARKLVDFSDLSRWCIRLFYDENGRTDAAKALADQFDEIMIDEYQDSNDLQETILTAVSHEADGRPNILMVGDAKQSIYGFRNARPQIFMEKYQTYPSEQASGYRKIELNRNFRSRPAVLSAANAVFSEIMHAEAGGIDYTEDVALNPGASFPAAPDETVRTAGKAEALLLDVSEKDSQGTLTDVDWEARMIGEEILRITDPENGLFVSEGKNSLRRAQFKDIVILTRKTTNNSNLIRTFESLNIPIFAESRESFYGTYEVSLAVNYLSVIDNALNDIPLYAYLRSPVCGFTDAELALIRTEADQKEIRGPFYLALTAYDAEDALATKVQAFLQALEEDIALSGTLSISALLRRFYEKTGIYEFVTAMPAGGQRRRNLEELLIRAERFEKTSYQGIFHFLRYIEEQRDNTQDGEPSIQEEDGNVVRLMTIHKSKGLEFPIVFTALCGNQYRGVFTEPFKKNYDYGFALPVLDLKRRTKAHSVFGAFIDAQNAKEEIGEEQRLLYVAMTRAKEQLYITGNYRMSAKNERIYEKPCCMDWLSKVFALPKGQETFEIRELRISDLLTGAEENRRKQELEKAGLLQALYENRFEDKALTDRLSYRYLYNDLYRLPVTLSVSKLKQMAMEAEGLQEAAEEDVFSVDDLPETDDAAGKARIPSPGETISGAARGTLYHYVMEFLSRNETAEELLARLEKEGLISGLEKDTINSAKVEQFRRSTLAKRFFDALDAGKAFRERKFIVGFPAAELFQDRFADIPADTRIMVQGIMDMYFEEEDGFVIVDYKTDRVQDAEELTMRYHGQLALYAKALHQITGKKVKETWIYSFSLGKAIAAAES